MCASRLLGKRVKIHTQITRFAPNKAKLSVATLAGSVVTGPAAAGFSDMTEGAAAVIPEVLAGQILSLARRGSGGPGHTVLTASRDDCLARDRLVVLLEPMPAAGYDSGGDNDHGAQSSREDSSAARPADQGVRRQRQCLQAKAEELVTAGADERPRHALVLPCIPGQVSIQAPTPWLAAFWVCYLGISVLRSWIGVYMYVLRDKPHTPNAPLGGFVVRRPARHTTQ